MRRNRSETPSKTRHFTEGANKIEVDGDTIRVKLPDKERSIAFELRNITTEFLQSSRTDSAARFFGVFLYCTVPTELGIKLQTKLGEFGGESVTSRTDEPILRPEDVTMEQIAEQYGVTLTEYEEAQRLAWEFGLKSLQRPS